jgi:phosphotriesterase-related protein
MIIRTVRGDIDPLQLGVCTCHEHLLWTVPEPYAEEDPDLGFDSIPAAVAEMRHFKGKGGNALVEMTTAEIGRAPKDLCQIALATNTHIIAATGHHKHKFSARALNGLSLETITQGIIRDITTGIDGTSIRAGVIKAATSKNEATEIERLIIRAAAAAHQATGAPVATHTEGGTYAVEQATLLIEAGVAPQHLLIGHLDRNQPLSVYTRLAEMGVYLGFDQIGKEKYWPDAARIKLIQTLIDLGYTQQILLSCDHARKSGWHTHHPHQDGPAYLLTRFIPALQSAGVLVDNVNQMLIHNPSRFLAFEEG